jgi:hypothetical protein
MKRFIPLLVAALALFAAVPSGAQSPVPLGLMRFGTTGVFNPQAGNCLSIFAMNSSGQSATDSGVPCSPAVVTTAYTNATTAYTAVTALPAVQGALTVIGECNLIWEGSSTSLTPTFAMGNSAAPTDLWAIATTADGVDTAPVYTTITSTTTTAVTGALTTTATATPYKTTLYFTLANAASADTVSVYAKSNNASYTVTVEPGSFCTYLP